MVYRVGTGKNKEKEKGKEERCGKIKRFASMASEQLSKEKFIEKFIKLIEYYEQLHDEHEYRPHKVSTKVFYNNFLRKLDQITGTIKGNAVKEVIGKLRDKAEKLAGFDERVRLHDLAERMVDRLNDVAIELYSIPDMEFAMKNTSDLEINMLFECCPEFYCPKKPSDGGIVGCTGTLKQIKMKPGDDLEAVVRMYYEKFCRKCKKDDGARFNKIEDNIYYHA